VNKTFLLVGALFAFLGVAFGAFGAHSLRGRLSPEMLAVFETGVRYQMYHALAILLVGLMMSPMGGWAIHTAGWAFVIGIVLTMIGFALRAPVAMGAARARWPFGFAGKVFVAVLLRRLFRPCREKMQLQIKIRIRCAH